MLAALLVLPRLLPQHAELRIVVQHLEIRIRAERLRIREAQELQRQVFGRPLMVYAAIAAQTLEREGLPALAKYVKLLESLGISVNTARGYVQQVLEKLGAHSRLEAVVRANELGLLDA